MYVRVRPSLRGTISALAIVQQVWLSWPAAWVLRDRKLGSLHLFDSSNCPSVAQLIVELGRKRSSPIPFLATKQHNMYVCLSVCICAGVTVCVCVCLHFRDCAAGPVSEKVRIAAVAQNPQRIELAQGTCENSELFFSLVSFSSFS